MTVVRIDLDRFLGGEAARWRGELLGVLCRPASVDASLVRRRPPA